MSVTEPLSSNPWQPALDKRTTPPPAPQLQRESSGNNAWSEAPQISTALTSQSSHQPVLVDIERPESPAWDEEEDSPVELPTDNGKGKLHIEPDRNAWDDGPSRANITPPAIREQIPQNDGWNLIDHEPRDEQQSGVVTGSGAILENYPSRESEHAPALPPRRSEENPPVQPPRPTLDTITSTSSVTSPGTRAQKKETYEVKKVSWHDVNAAKNPRISPILVQNLNGPCPLLALVNALTLSTPANVETALVETLRSRERVSLGLLLDAVFDELMSGRRGDAAHDLPDVGDLYSFLVTLHTGMNVNPRFVPVVKSTTELRSSMSHVHPSERQAAMPGTFEDTREMKLYSTFSIPLIHGWLPERDSHAFLALSRSAKSYEDAQNLMFHEEGLEDKLQREGLSFEEQGTLEDIGTIKAFFASNATQLTPYGLQTITNSVAPGAVAILFRNDHFSTLYRHPDTLQLLQLVTDSGYAGHEEVVWESLIDVNGENAEFFSGDFRLVGGPTSSLPSSSQQASHPSGDGWTTVPGRRSSPQISTTHQDHSPQSPTTEQEDHDLALALQLQEEEEERHRNEVERRRRETELSQQYIEQQGNNAAARQQQPQNGRGRGQGQPRGGLASNARPSIPPRRTGTNPGGQPIDSEVGADAPPPSYEQAANSAAYVPPNDHHAHPNADPRAQRRSSAFNASTSSFGRQGRRMSSNAGPSNAAGRGQPQGLGQTGQLEGDKQKDCIVM